MSNNTNASHPTISVFVDFVIESALNGADFTNDATKTEVADAYAKVHVARRGEAVLKFTMAAYAASVDTDVISGISDILANYADFATKSDKSGKDDKVVKMAKALIVLEAAMKVIRGNPDFSDIEDDTVISAMEDIRNNTDFSAEIAKNAQTTAKAAFGPNGTKTRYTDTMANLLERGDVVIGDVLRDKVGNGIIVEGSDKFRILDEEDNPTDLVFTDLSAAGGHFTQRSTNGWIHFFQGETVIGDLRVN